MDLKEILLANEVDEEKANKILSTMKEKEIYLSKEENIDERYNKLKTQKEDADTKLKTANETIENLKQNNQSNEDLQTQIEDYKVQVETLNEQSLANQKQAAIDLALVKAGARNPKAVNALLDTEKIEIEEGGVVGLDEQLEALGESDAYLFQSEEEGTKGPQIQTGEEPNGDNGEDNDPFEDFIEERYG